MKHLVLKALLDTLPVLVCTYYDQKHYICNLIVDKDGYHLAPQCDGNIRECEAGKYE